MTYHVADFIPGVSERPSTPEPVSPGRAHGEPLDDNGEQVVAHHAPITIGLERSLAFMSPAVEHRNQLANPNQVPSAQSIAFQALAMAAHPEATASNTAAATDPTYGMQPLPPPTVGEADTASTGSDNDGSVHRVGFKGSSESTGEVIVSQSSPEPKWSNRRYYISLKAHHRWAMIDLMKTKLGQITEYEKMMNYTIMHLDWAAKNPKDPRVRSNASQGSKIADTLSEEDRNLRARVAAMVANFTAGNVVDFDADDQVSWNLFFSASFENA